MADTKISALTGATTPLDGTEVLPIVQSGTTKKVANNDLRPKQIQSNATSGVLQVANISAAATRVMTVPDADFSAARTDAAQSFTGVNTFVTAGTGTGAPIYVAPTSNALTDVYVGRNLSTGTSAYTRFALGNNATPAGFTMAQYGGNHSTRPNQVQINNEFTSSISISANGGADNMVLASNGNLTLDTGNLVIGTSGKGIDFSAAGGSVLTQYREGDFTSTVSPQTSGSITLSSTQDSLHYTKIGTVCCVQGRLTVSSVSSPDGYMRIYLPFTAGSLAEDGDVTPCTVVFNGNTTTQHYFSFISPATDYIQVYASVESVSNSTTNCANYVQAGSEIFVSATYVTT